jgi:hypothetical protein
VSQSSERLPKNAWVVTFYAHKGGTGRTLALSNVARYLAEQGGYRIGLVDLDTESPGLPHEALCPDLEESAGRQDDSSPRRKLQKQINGCWGFMELFNALYEQNWSRFEDDQVRDPDQLEVGTEQLTRHVLPLPSDRRSNGTLLLMPAASGSVEIDNNFLTTLAAFTRKTARPGALHFNALLTSRILRWFIEEFYLDFVFLDGRTGSGTFSPIYVYSVPHALVLFVGLTEQNISGSLEILKELTDPEVKPAPVFLAASPVPTGGPECLERRMNRLEAELARHRQQRERDGQAAYVYQVPDRVEFALPYTDLAAYQETYFIRNYPRSGLAREYVQLAVAIEGLVAGGREPLTAARTAQEKRQRLLEPLARAGQGRPLRLAVEDVHQEAFDQFLTRHLGLAPAGPGEVLGTQGWLKRYRQPGGGQVEVEYWPNVAEDAPWERLSCEPAAGPPPRCDLLTIPQSFLGALCADEPGALPFRDLGGLRRAREADRGNFAIFDYHHLDSWFPNWRRWCTLGSRVVGLPFSANASLLCANEHLLGKLCHEYWEKKPRGGGWPGGHDATNVFLPSSWQLVADLIDAARSNWDWYPFAFSTQRWNLYLEWLNVVVAHGDVDVEVGEGNIVTGRGLGEGAKRGTRLFLRLLGKERQPPEITMSELIQCFSENRLGVYMGWSDSFRFEWQAGTREVERTRPVRLPGQDLPRSDPSLVLRLGPVPREVPFPRRPVLAGWIMVVPAQGPERIDLALRFADCFLAPEVQRDLLREGFPTPSLPTIEEELRWRAYARSGAAGRAGTAGDGLGRELARTNYEVFLGAMRDALTVGHWVPSVQGATEVIDRICAGLDYLRQDPSRLAQVDEVIDRLRADVDEILKATPTQF